MPFCVLVKLIESVITRFCLLAGRLFRIRVASPNMNLIRFPGTYKPSLSLQSVHMTMATDITTDKRNSYGIQSREFFAMHNSLVIHEQ